MSASLHGFHEKSNAEFHAAALSRKLPQRHQNGELADRPRRAE
jgi:hypothetical protein